jgi:hypothetical protein
LIRPDIVVLVDARGTFLVEIKMFGDPTGLRRAEAQPVTL